MSVILYYGISKDDTESNTSNLLAKILGLEGVVLIGDKALVSNYHNPNCIDLAKAWNDKYRLPFVFARFCCNSNIEYFKKLLSLYRPKRVPYYILFKISQKLDIPVWYIRLYLSKIEYKIDTKAKKGLKSFLSKAYKIKIDNNLKK
jgi:chorismate dehydratase